MTRKLIGALGAAVILTSLIASAALLWPATARSTAGRGIDANFDHAFDSITQRPQRIAIPAFLPMIDFERLFTGANALPRREYVPVRLTAIDFDRIFGSVTAARHDNTPPNRERLRNAGWKRLLGQV
jgi:hypothetical protein